MGAGVVGTVFAWVIALAAIGLFGWLASLVFGRNDREIVAPLTSSCERRGWAVEYLGWDGSLQMFRFMPSYAEAMVRANPSKAVNVPGELLARVQDLNAGDTRSIAYRNESRRG